MWQISVTGHCEPDGTPCGVYVSVEDEELFDWLDTHGWLDDDAYDYINTKYNAIDIMVMAMEEGTEALVGCLDDAKRIVFKDMTESGIIQHCLFGAIGRMVDDGEVADLE